jgi:hypothetical protein
MGKGYGRDQTGSKLKCYSVIFPYALKTARVLADIGHR